MLELKYLESEVASTSQHELASAEHYREVLFPGL